MDDYNKRVEDVRVYLKETLVGSGYILVIKPDVKKEETEIISNIRKDRVLDALESVVIGARDQEF